MTDMEEDRQLEPNGRFLGLFMTAYSTGISTVLTISMWLVDAMSPVALHVWQIIIYVCGTATILRSFF